MKLALIGAPGSGKTYIARFIAHHLQIDHIECDVPFWAGEDVREVVRTRTQSEAWILDGHLSKVSDLVLPEVHHLIVIDNLAMKSLARSLKRDWNNPKRIWFNLQNYEKMAKKREAMVAEFSGSVLRLNNFPNLSESKLAAFCEDLKTTTVKAKKPAVKRQRP